jgi:hypothetical protein
MDLRIFSKQIERGGALKASQFIHTELRLFGFKKAR